MIERKFFVIDLPKKSPLTTIFQRRMEANNAQGGRSSTSQVIVANNQSPVQSLVHQTSKHSVPRSSVSRSEGGQPVVNSMVNIDGQKIEYNSENS